MSDFIGFQVINQLNLTDAEATATINVYPLDHGIAEEEGAYGLHGDMLVKVTATTAKTVTVKNNGDKDCYLFNILASTTVTKVGAGSTTTVALTANTPALLAVCHVTAVADTE